MVNIAVFGSGRGSNFRAILGALEEGRLPDTRIVCVISNNSGAGILETAREHSIPSFHLSPKNFPTVDAYVESLHSLLQSRGTTLILLGYWFYTDAIKEFLMKDEEPARRPYLWGARVMIVALLLVMLLLIRKA